MTWTRPFDAISVCGSTPSAGPDLRGQRIERLAAVHRIAGITPAAVVLPPDAPLNG